MEQMEQVTEQTSGYCYFFSCKNAGKGLIFTENKIHFILCKHCYGTFPRGVSLNGCHLASFDCKKILLIWVSEIVG